jgi:hypothetical protein
MRNGKLLQSILEFNKVLLKLSINLPSNNYGNSKLWYTTYILFNYTPQTELLDA